METSSGADGKGAERPGTRAVRVSYEVEGLGPALVLGEEPADCSGDGDDRDTGVLRFGAAVMTLEIPRPGGGRTTLSWDPDEVELDPLVA